MTQEGPGQFPFAPSRGFQPVPQSLAARLPLPKAEWHAVPRRGRTATAPDLGRGTSPAQGAQGCGRTGFAFNPRRPRNLEASSRVSEPHRGHMRRVGSTATGSPRITRTSNCPLPGRRLATPPAGRSLLRGRTRRTSGASGSPRAGIGHPGHVQRGRRGLQRQSICCDPLYVSASLTWCIRTQYPTRYLVLSTLCTRCGAALWSLASLRPYAPSSCYLHRTPHWPGPAR